MTSGGQRDRLKKALERRASLRAIPGLTCFRAVNAEADGLPGLTVDLFADVAVASLYAPLQPGEERRLALDLQEVCRARAVYLKRRPKEARVVATTEKALLAPEPPLAGEPVPELTALEGGLRYVIRPAQGLSVGLYLDMRDPRAWLREHVMGRTVLNCFAYTCAFGVVALAGGAVRAVNLDLSRRALDWGQENARANGQPAEARDYISGDVFDWLARFSRKGERFDVVVLDPPSFAKGKRGAFSAATGYGRLAALAAPVVAPGGLLLAACNLHKLYPERFLAAVEQGALDAGRRIARSLPLRASPVDFPTPEGQPPSLKVFALWLDGGGARPRGAKTS